MQKLLGFSILSGLILSAGFPSLGFPLLLFIGFVPLFLLDDEIIGKYKKNQKKRLFAYTFLTFFMWNAITIWWLHNAKHPDGSYAWDGFFIATIANAFFMSSLFVLYSWVKKITGDYIGTFFFIALWISFEKVHLEWELTFPWFNLGNGFAGFYKWIQWYEFTGALGGTLWILILNAIFYHGIKEYKRVPQKKFIYRTVIVASAFILIPTAISFYIYETYEEKGEKINVTIIQPKLDPYTEKYKKPGIELVADLLDLAQKNITQETDFVVCPETAFPGNGSIFLNEINTDLNIIEIKKWLENYPKLNFISGVQLYQSYKLGEEISNTARNNGEEYLDFYNSGIQLNNKNAVQIYQKSKFVPGVEAFPYAQVLTPLLGNIMLDFGGTVSSLGKQKERTPFVNANNNAIVAAIICYEAIYGEYITDFIKNGSNVLFMMSNDSWWDDSDGYKELFLFSRLRAIETRKSIVRSANSGVSAIINQRGDVVKQLKYGKKGAINGKVQLNNEKTDYVQYGDFISRIALFIAGIIFAFTLSQKILSKKG